MKQSCGSICSTYYMGVAMRTEISAREANQHLSRYLDAVQNGDEIIITRRGKSVAKLVGFEQKRTLTEAQMAARDRLLAIMGTGNAVADLPGRDELYSGMLGE